MHVDTQADGHFNGLWRSCQNTLCAEIGTALRSELLVLRSLKQDCVPTTACTFSFRGVESSGTYAYYLTSAFKQVYVPPERTWAVTGWLFVIALILKLFEPLPLKSCKFSKKERRTTHND